MDVLMIGGTRYMGRIFAERLIERGDNLTVFSRGKTKPHWWDEVEHVTGDREDVEDFSAKLKGRKFDAVVDTIAFKKEDVESAVKTFQGNVGRYMFVSTGAVYLDGKLDFYTHCPLKESDVDWSSLDYTYPEGEQPYGVGKRHCEKWLQENSTVPYTIIRVPAVMGWDDPSYRMWWWVQRALDGGPVVVPEEGQAVFRTLYVGDAGVNWLRAIDEPAAANQTYHISMKEIMTVSRWAGLIWSAAGHQSSVTYVPQAVIDKTLKEHAPPLSRAWPYIQDLSKAESDFGYKTTPVEEWIQTTVDWYRDKYKEGDSQGYEHRDAELALAAKWNERHSKLVEEF